MENVTSQRTDVEEGTPTFDDGHPELPDWPVLMHVGRYKALRFVCPHDRRPMENESAPFSLNSGTYSCSGGHQWSRSLGEWFGHRMPVWQAL